MRASFLTVVSLLVSAVIAAPVVTDIAVQPRAKTVCKIFQIWAEDHHVGTGKATWVGQQSCCCTNAQCHVIDRQDGINTSANLDEYLAGTFNLNDQGGHTGVGSLDSGDWTYTVGSQGGCDTQSG